MQKDFYPFESIGDIIARREADGLCNFKQVVQLIKAGMSPGNASLVKHDEYEARMAAIAAPHTALTDSGRPTIYIAKAKHAGTLKQRCGRRLRIDDKSTPPNPIVNFGGPRLGNYRRKRLLERNMKRLAAIDCAIEGIS